MVIFQEDAERHTLTEPRETGATGSGLTEMACEPTGQRVEARTAQQWKPCASLGNVCGQLLNLNGGV